MNLKEKIIQWFVNGVFETFKTGEMNLKTRLIVDKIAEEVNKMASWRTTLFGILSAAGTGLLTVKEPAWVSTLGQIMAAIGVAGMGLSARDNKVSSEQAGAK